MGEHLAAPCCGIENMKEPGTRALQWSERQHWKGDGAEIQWGIASGLKPGYSCWWWRSSILLAGSLVFLPCACSCMRGIKRRTTEFGLCLNTFGNVPGFPKSCSWEKLRNYIPLKRRLGVLNSSNAFKNIDVSSGS